MCQTEKKNLPRQSSRNQLVGRGHKPEVGFVATEHRMPNKKRGNRITLWRATGKTNKNNGEDQLNLMVKTTVCSILTILEDPELGNSFPNLTNYY